LFYRENKSYHLFVEGVLVRVGNQPVEDDVKVDESALLAALKKGYENISKNFPKVYEEEWKRGKGGEGG
jgi:hypothetical protein